MKLLSPEKQKRLEENNEVGASNWLSALPIKEHGFYLDKQTFWDVLYIRYGYILSRLPSKCVCGDNFTIVHALSCAKGGFISMRHNEIRDLTAELIHKVCYDVETEPKLNPVTEEKFALKTANTNDEARVDVSARSFWVRGQKAFFDVRIFNPTAKCYSTQSLNAAHKRNENEKKRSYNERIQEIEH